METYNQSQVISLEVLKRREKGRRFRERHREEINEQQRKRRQEKRDEKKRLDIYINKNKKQSNHNVTHCL